MTLSTDKIMDETVEILSLAKNRTLDLERLILRALTQADLSDYHELTSDDAALKYDYPAHQTIEESEEMLVKWHLSIPFGKYGVYHKKDAKIIGSVSIRLGENADAYIGYTFNQNYWHKGYATEAVSALIQLVFTQTKLSPVLAEVDQENTASVSLLKRLGFKFLTRKENIKNARGRLIAEDTYLLEKSEIRNQQSKMIK